jgi:hypothetical protein
MSTVNAQCVPCARLGMHHASVPCPQPLHLGCCSMTISHFEPLAATRSEPISFNGRSAYDLGRGHRNQCRGGSGGFAVRAKLAFSERWSPPGYTLGLYPVQQPPSAPTGFPRPTRVLAGFLSNSSTLLVGVNPSQPGAALRQRRAPGQGATAPAVERRRRRRIFQSHLSWPWHSLQGSITMV